MAAIARWFALEYTVRNTDLLQATKAALDWSDDAAGRAGGVFVG